MIINENIIHRALMESLRKFLSEDGATAAGGGATSTCNTGMSAGVNGAGNGFEYDVPVGGKSRRGGTVMRRTFWNAGNSEKTMQKADDEGTDVVNKRRKR